MAEESRSNTASPLHAARRSAPIGRGALIACLLLLLALTGCAGRPGDASLTVINGVDGALCSVRVKKASSQTFWGRNRLRSGQRLEPGASLTLALPAGYYDADAHLCDDAADPGYMRYDIHVDAQAGGVWLVGEYLREGVYLQSRSVRLSDEELALLLGLAAIPQPAGHPAVALPETAPDRAELADGLAARGLLLPQADGGWAVNDDLQRMLRLAAAPDAVLLVTSKEDNALQPQQESYYRLGDAVMRYYRPYDGINDFALVAEPLDLTASLMTSLQYYTAGERVPALQAILAQDSLSQAQAAANRGEAAQAEQILLQAGASAAVSSTLAATMAAPAVRLDVVVLLPHSQPDVPRATFLCDARRCWSVQLQEGPAPAVALETVDLAAIAPMLQRLIETWAAPTYL